MDFINHHEYGDCFKLLNENDINLTRMLTGSTVSSTILSSGLKTPPVKLIVKPGYLIYPNKK